MKPPIYRRAEFLLSAQQLTDLPEDSGYEVAFAGRSNAGKSTALNAIADIRGLARTSKTPGRTQMINLFGLDDERRLADLPGYGYAKVPEAIKRHWSQVLERYLQSRRCLRGLILIMDVRHPLTEHDRTMLGWCSAVEMPVHVLLTKADKLKRGAAGNALLQVRRALGSEYPNTTVQLFSGTAKQGVDEARAVLDGWFELDHSGE